MTPTAPRLRSCALLALLLCPGGALANDTAFGGHASRPYPITSEAVEMVREQVTLKLVGHDRWEVRCRFLFRNATDRPVALRMGFPFAGNRGEGDLAVPRGLKAPPEGRPLVWRFRATVRGKPVATKLRRLDDRRRSLGLDWAHIWPVRLGPGQKVRVDNSYVLGVTQTSMAFLTEVSYLLRTGANWRGGRIGRSRLVVTADRPFLPCDGQAVRARMLGRTFQRGRVLAGFARPAEPAGFRIVRAGKRGPARRIEWDLRSFAPTKDLRACLVPASLHVLWLDYQLDSIDERKLDPAQLRLLINYHFAKHGKAFRSRDLRRYFGKRWWYRPDPRFTSARLSKGDWAKVKHLRAVLAQKKGRD